MKNNFTQMNVMLKRGVFVAALTAMPFLVSAQSNWEYACNACDAQGVGYNDISGQNLVGDMRIYHPKSSKTSKYLKFSVNDVPVAGTYEFTVYFATMTRSYLITVQQGDKKMCTVLTVDNNSWTNISAKTTLINLYEGDNIIWLTPFGSAEDMCNLSAGSDKCIDGPNTQKIELKPASVTIADWSDLSMSREAEAYKREESAANIGQTTSGGVTDVSLDNAKETPLVYNFGNMKAGRYLVEIDYMTMGNRSMQFGVNDEFQVLNCNFTTSDWHGDCANTGYGIVTMKEGSNKFMMKWNSGDAPNIDKFRLTYLSEFMGEDLSVNYSMPVKWGTLILPFGTVVPKNRTIYTCNGVDSEGVLLLTPVEATYEWNNGLWQYAQANTPYIVSGEVETFASFSGFGLIDNELHQNGCLVGTTLGGIQAPVGSYVLQNQQEYGLGFYLVGEEVQPTVGANRAYLVLPEENRVNGRALIFPGNTTGIAEVTGEEDGVVNVYSINGMLVRRNVAKAKALEGLQKGIYIVDGVKKVVK